MKIRKWTLHQWKHPLDAYPFEAIQYGSWQPVKYIKSESEKITLHFIDNHHMAIEKRLDIRIRSRKATLSDCSCFLLPGMDICVLSASQHRDDSNGVSPNPVWVDARIKSIHRNSHDSECSCQYYINVYVNQGSFSKETRILNKEVKVVGLSQISILQKLEHDPCEDQPHRWASSEDCTTVPQTKLLSGKFLSDLTWVFVTSIVKKVSLCARSVDNKIVYQILGSDDDSHINVLKLKIKDNGLLVPDVVQVDISSTKAIVQRSHDSHEDNIEVPRPHDDSLEVEVAQSNTNVEEVALAPSNNNVEAVIRRSKRKRSQPERYYACDVVPELDVGVFRTRPYKFRRCNKDIDDDDEPVPLIATVSDLQEKCEVSEDAAVTSTERVDNKVNSCKEIIVYTRRKKTKEVKGVEGNDNDNVTRNNGDEKVDIPSQDSHLNDVSKSKKKNIDILNFEPHKHAARSVNEEKVHDFSSRFHSSYSSTKVQGKKKNPSGPDDMDIEPRWEGLNSRKSNGEKSYRSTSSRSRRNYDEERARRDRALNANAYKEMIDSYLKNSNKISIQEEEASIKDPWMKTSNLGQKNEAETSQREEKGELSEMDKLWQEMEEAMTTCLLEETKDSNAAVSVETEEKSSVVCPHNYRLDEEIGICCIICGDVKIEIKYVFPPFLEMEHSARYREEKQSSEEDSNPNADEDDDFLLFPTHAPLDELILEENENVWSLIPELKKRMHVHQKKAFQFLWQNIAGSMEPALMESASKRTGGCVISHSPGAGKTFLMIAFLVSYLKLFPGCRPLVLAPKTTLFTWYKEFNKWGVSVPVYLIHSRRGQREFEHTSVAIPGVPNPNGDVKHVLDCLEKIQKWHQNPSILIMGYTSFLAMTRDDSKFAHKKYMAKSLREGPGIMIMDEGHNPRSTKSRLRKALMKVNTGLRILLSGTLFQNNFCEYFNTLCLARPKFVHEVLKELDPKFTRKGRKKAPHLLEARARKFFLNNIAKKIDSKDNEERMMGLNLLRNITNGFVDVYDNGNSDTLPGLQIYTLLMNSTDLQGEVLKKLHEKMDECRGYPMELELLITLGSIHPWLVKTSTCSEKFLTIMELENLDKYKLQPREGSKVRFVLSLVHRVAKNEKVLIFCHNIAPVKLLVELFDLYFHWKKGQEVLLLNGEQELFERGKVIEKFEETGGVSKVLVASITACSEGISLTAASRVIMLDSEWNPSKTKQAIARAFRPGQQKMVYVYQLLTVGSMEEEKYRKTTWKEWVSSMIFSEDFVEDPSKWQAEKIEDDILRELVEVDKSKSIHMIMKNEKASTN